MISDTEIRKRGLRVLTESLGSVEAEKFIALIQRERFDYTEWSQDLFEGMTVEQISEAASRPLGDHPSDSPPSLH